MKTTILVILLVVLAACTQSPGVEKPFFANEAKCKNAGGEWVETPFDPHRCSIASQTDCERLEGSWEKRGLLGQEMCIFTYPDAGKECTRTEECLGGCVLDSPEKLQGQCKETDTIFGCWTFVDGPAVCVD